MKAQPLLSTVISAVRLTRWWMKPALLRHALADLPEGEGADLCVFDALEDYPKSYAKLASILAQREKSPPRAEIDFLRAMLDRSTRYGGAIGSKDFFFLTAFLSILAPRRAVEIGTLTGFSAAVIASALARQNADRRNVWVDTIDARERCLIDESRPTGFEIPDLVPKEEAALLRLHVPHDATYVEQLARPNELEWVFIDADHRHPMPLLDLLRVAPFLNETGWILVHDIRLGTLGQQATARGENQRWGAPFGAEIFFQEWPFRKIDGGNIGAVQLPSRRSDLIPFALRLLRRPMEIEGRKKSRRAKREIYQRLESFASTACSEKK